MMNFFGRRWIPYDWLEQCITHVCDSGGGPNANTFVYFNGWEPCQVKFLRAKGQGSISPHISWAAHGSIQNAWAHAKKQLGGWVMQKNEDWPGCGAIGNRQYYSSGQY